MNLAASISVYGGGPGSGCHGENCGRPKISLEKLRDDFGRQVYKIRDQEGKALGAIMVGMQSDEYLEVGWIAGNLTEQGDFARIGNVSVVRPILRELKKLYPQAKRIGGNRTTGVHVRTHSPQVNIHFGRGEQHDGY